MVTSDGLHLAPPLSGSPRVAGSPDALVRILLHGLMGEVDGKTYPGAMVPMKANDDQWVAEVLTYIRNNFGNNAPTITLRRWLPFAPSPTDWNPTPWLSWGPI
ncbi:c-type cytochrome [Verrucomicrobium spinosum]|uniref:c-type cytochrome n=1 Tax=Verrucomicrobium spinosum TaxID=2736 RepID=UPI0009462DAD|nr:hypothetical protein [Verrucomicrobium spinosum]